MLRNDYYYKRILLCWPISEEGRGHARCNGKNTGVCVLFTLGLNGGKTCVSKSKIVNVSLDFICCFNLSERTLKCIKCATHL